MAPIVDWYKEHKPRNLRLVEITENAIEEALKTNPYLANLATVTIWGCKPTGATDGSETRCAIVLLQTVNQFSQDKHHVGRIFMDDQGRYDTCKIYSSIVLDCAHSHRDYFCKQLEEDARSASTNVAPTERISLNSFTNSRPSRSRYDLHYERTLHRKRRENIQRTVHREWRENIQRTQHNGRRKNMQRTQHNERRANMQRTQHNERRENMQRTQHNERRENMQHAQHNARRQTTGIRKIDSFPQQKASSRNLNTRDNPQSEHSATHAPNNRYVDEDLSNPYGSSLVLDYGTEGMPITQLLLEELRNA